MILQQRSCIFVLAGVNGAGKSTIAGAAFREHGADYYNPDEAAARLIAVDRNLSLADANSTAWRQGVKLLQRAIEQRLDFAFETTLGANTIPRLLRQAAAEGIEVYIWYVGLSSPELHIRRVASRIRGGGHAIAPEHIYRRFEHSRLNLIQLLPFLAALRIYDNSSEADPALGKTPKPKLVLYMERGKIVGPHDLKYTPEWAKPIVAAALKL
jgi:predicted ABC-type ATPase